MMSFLIFLTSLSLLCSGIYGNSNMCHSAKASSISDSSASVPTRVQRAGSSQCRTGFEECGPQYCCPRETYCTKDTNGSPICCPTGYSCRGILSSYSPTTTLSSTNTPNNARRNIAPLTALSSLFPVAEKVPAQGNVLDGSFANSYSLAQYPGTPSPFGYKECGNTACCPMGSLCTEDINANFACCPDPETRTALPAATASLADVGAGREILPPSHPGYFAAFAKRDARLAKDSRKPSSFAETENTIQDNKARKRTAADYFSPPLGISIDSLQKRDGCAGHFVEEWQTCCVDDTLPYYYSTGDRGCCPDDLQGLSQQDIEAACPITVGRANLIPLGKSETSDANRNQPHWLYRLLSTSKVDDWGKAKHGGPGAGIFARDSLDVTSIAPSSSGISQEQLKSTNPSSELFFTNDRESSNHIDSASDLCSPRKRQESPTDGIADIPSAESVDANETQSNPENVSIQPETKYYIGQNLGNGSPETLRKPFSNSLIKQMITLFAILVGCRHGFSHA